MKALIVALFLMFVPFLVKAQSLPACDVALVMAVDVSGSITDDEWKLERLGMAQAIMDSLVVDAVVYGPIGTIAIALVQWAEKQELTIDWVLVSSQKDIEQLAYRIATMERFKSISTGAGNGLKFATEVMETVPCEPIKRVIDVNGDGRNNDGPEPDFFRDEAVARGIVINGLAMINDEKDLEEYYRDHIIGGPGSFVLVINSYREFVDALRKKLVNEIG